MSNQNHNFNFQGKIIINADLRCVTGLYIGGTEEGFEIGGVDNIVVKDPLTSVPYIPGSSLKGKMRSLLEWADGRVIENIKPKTDEKNKESKEQGWKCEPCSCGECDVCIIFGSSATAANKGPTRLTVRDAFPKGFINENGERNPKAEQIQKWEQYLGEKIYTELKTENTIDRITSSANPRTMERVPADSIFTVEMIFDLYTNDDKSKLKKVFEAMSLLEDSSLGGGGSRGSGKIKFENIKIYERDIEYYIGKNNQKKLTENKTLREIFKNFESIFSI